MMTSLTNQVEALQNLNQKLIQTCRSLVLNAFGLDYSNFFRGEC